MPDQPTGSSGLTSAPIRSPISSSESTPSAIAIRFSVPNRLIATGISPRVGRSKSSAGPPARTVRVTTSLISRVGSTGTLDPPQLPRALQRREEVLEIGVREATSRHARQSPAPGPRADQAGWCDVRGDRTFPRLRWRQAGADAPHAAWT